MSCVSFFVFCVCLCALMSTIFWPEWKLSLAFFLGSVICLEWHRNKTQCKFLTIIIFIIIIIEIDFFFLLSSFSDITKKKNCLNFNTFWDCYKMCEVRWRKKKKNLYPGSFEIVFFCYFSKRIKISENRRSTLQPRPQLKHIFVTINVNLLFKIRPRKITHKKRNSHSIQIRDFFFPLNRYDLF